MQTSELKKKLDSAIDFLESELSQIRTGRVTTTLLDTVSVEAYGTRMTLREVGTISVLDPQTLQVSPWDKGLLEAISSAIRESDLGLNPVSKSDVVLIPVPPLTEDRRKEFAKMATLKVENVKNTIRGVRQEAMKAIDADFANKAFGEDDKFRFKDEVEDIVKKYTEKAEELGETKKTDIMSVGK